MQPAAALLILIVCSVVLLILIASTHAAAQSFTDNAPLRTVLFGRPIVPTIQLPLPPFILGQLTYTDPVTTSVLRHPGEFRWWQTCRGHPVALSLGVGFGGGETDDLTRLMLQQPAANSAWPNEVQIGLRIPF